MRTPHRGLRLTAALTVALFLAPIPAAQGGTLVEFTLKPFDDTLFASVDAAYRVAFDHRGHLWYTTPSGVVDVDIENHTRQLYTRVDGLPSSYSLGLAVRDGKVYVGTELGIGVIDIETGRVTAHTTQNSRLPDAIVQEIVPVGDELYLGTYFGGVAVWNPDTDEWSVKNTSTTARHAEPVKRITASADAVWVATDGDGVWRRDRATGEWSVLLRDDGLVTNDVRVAREIGGILYVGSEKGLQVRGTDGAWVHLNKTTSNLPDDYVLDIDFIPTEGGGLDLFASTRDGVWQYDEETGEAAVRRQEFGILGTFVLDNAFTPAGWAIATSRGVSVQRAGEWSYYVTGPSSPEVPSEGPGSFMFTSASVGNSGPVIWFGGPAGIFGYRPAEGSDPGVWYNRGEWSNYTGGPVNWIDTEGHITWVGSNTGAFGYNHATQEWFERKVTNSRNLVYGLEADRGELWIGLFGDGLIMRNLTTGVTRSWTIMTTPPIPDPYVTDVRAQGNDIWIGSQLGVTRMDRATGTFVATYTDLEGIPGGGVVYRLLPENNVVWIATKSHGVARLDVEAAAVTHVWNASNTPGFPDGEVRALHRESNRLWIGTTDGLARIDLSTLDVKTYRTSDSDLVQNYVNGITSRDGILYLATLSGVARLDLATDEFLPMHEGDHARAARDDAPRAPTGQSVRVNIFSPRHLELVSGVVEVSGSAQSGAGAVDRVEVQVGDGPWMPAEGTTSWTYAWNTTTLTPDETVAVRARAFAGSNVSRAAEVLAIPIKATETPLVVEALPPPGATAGRALKLFARADGDPPLTVTAFYRAAGADAYSRAELKRNGSMWEATIPARDVAVGDLSYYVEARSGRHVKTDPVDLTQPYVLNVTAAPVVSVRLDAPPHVDAPAGTPTPIVLRVTNTGTEPVTVRVDVNAEGPAARWIQLPDELITLQAGEDREVTATASVDAGAYDQERRVTIAVVDASDQADPATAEFPLRIRAAQQTAAPTPTGEEKERGGFGIPMPAPVAVAALAALAALALRRRRSA